MDDWVADGTHIAALGADKRGDQELDPRILKRARIFVDDIRQCRTDGEINVPLATGLLTERDIAGEIARSSWPQTRRRSAAEITVFDSTGIAFRMRDGAARVRAGARGRSRHRKEDDFDVIRGWRSHMAGRPQSAEHRSRRR